MCVSAATQAFRKVESPFVIFVMATCVDSQNTLLFDGNMPSFHGQVLLVKNGRFSFSDR
jgi:hypothetical protein